MSPFVAELPRLVFHLVLVLTLIAVVAHLKRAERRPVELLPGLLLRAWLRVALAHPLPVVPVSVLAALTLEP